MLHISGLRTRELLVPGGSLGGYLRVRCHQTELSKPGHLAEKPLHCPVRVWTQGEPASPALQMGMESTEPKLLQVSPVLGPEVGKLVLEGVVFLPLFKTGRAKRELPLGLWGGDVLLLLRTPRRFRGRALGAVGRNSSKHDLLCLPY